MNTISNSKKGTTTAPEISEALRKIFFFAGMYGFSFALNAFVGMGIVTGLIETQSLSNKIIWGFGFALVSGMLGFMTVVAIYFASYNSNKAR